MDPNLREVDRPPTKSDGLNPGDVLFMRHTREVWIVKYDGTPETYNVCVSRDSEECKEFKGPRTEGKKQKNYQVTIDEWHCLQRNVVNHKWVVNEWGVRVKVPIKRRKPS